jgi:hypothetical protein
MEYFSPPLLCTSWADCRVVVHQKLPAGGLWLEDVAAKPPWRELLDSDGQVWRTAPGRAQRCWVLAGLIRPPSPLDVRAVTVTLDDGMAIAAAVCEQAWLAVLPLPAGDRHPCVRQFDANGAVLQTDRFSSPLTSYLGTNPDGGGWTAYAPLE